jgi:hypothetical protein
MIGEERGLHPEAFEIADAGFGLQQGGDNAETLSPGERLQQGERALEVRIDRWQRRESRRAHGVISIGIAGSVDRLKRW